MVIKDSTIKRWVKLSGMQAGDGRFHLEVGVPLVCYLHYMSTITRHERL